MAGDNDGDDLGDFFPDHSLHVGREDGDDSKRDDHSADFQLPLPPLSDEDVIFLRAVAARAEAEAAADGRSGGSGKEARAPLRRLIAAYDAEAAQRGVQWRRRELAAVYQGYLLRMSDGAAVDELVAGCEDGGNTAAAAKRKRAKL